jgi:SAM-dependent methyltransferase
MPRPLPAAPSTPAEWFAAPLGRYVIGRELEYMDSAVADVFGFNALQLGLPEHDFLRASRMALRSRVAPHGAADLRADFLDLPVASHSVDLLVLPHVLEFSPHPHQVLREVQRVLMPEGHALIVGFNPRSLWGLRRLFNRARGAYPWHGRFINLSRLKDWLSLLELEIVAGRTGCYVPPCAQQKWIQRFGFMENAGDRWWPIAGGVYFLHVVKRVRGMRIIMPKWREQVERRRNLAVVPKAQSNDEPAAARDAVDAR